MRVFSIFCTYISERVFITVSDKPGRGSKDMYDTAKRVALVKQRVWENTRRRQRRGIYRLSTACMLLCTVLMQAAGMIIGKGQTATRGVFGTMLLREDAGGYVLVAIVSFAAAVVITVLCFRLRIRENRTDTNRRRQANEETNTQHPGDMLHGIGSFAHNRLCR